MFCTNCGKRVPDGSVFCTECGHRLDVPAPRPDEPAPAVPEEKPASEDPALAGEPVSEVEPAPIDVPAAEGHASADAPTAEPESASAGDSAPEAEPASSEPEPAVEPAPTGTLAADPEPAEEPASPTAVLPACGDSSHDSPSAPAPAASELVCPSCGAVMPADTHFCTECGQALDTASGRPAASEAASFTCPHCGEQHPVGTRFCTSTGAPIDGAAADPLDAIGTDPVPVAAVPDATVAMPKADHPAKAKRSTGKTVGIVVAAVLVVAALGVGGFFAYKNFLAPASEEAEGVRKEEDGSVKIDEESFSDDTMRAYIEEQVDSDGDGKLSQEECEAVTSIDLGDVSTVDNLALFPNLESLTVSQTAQVEEPIDLSGNANLGSLSLPDNAVVDGIDATQLREEWLATSCTTYSGSDLDYTYVAQRDENGVPTEVDHGGAGNPQISSKFTYDSDGNLTQRVSTSGGTSTVYNYEYDADGNMVRATWGDNVNTYSYDSDGNLTSVTQNIDGQSYTATFAYDSEGRCTEKSYAGGEVERWEYDEDGRCVSYARPVTDSFDITYGEDEVTFSGTGGSGTYALDDEGRIESATSDEATATCEYNESGCLTEVVVTYNDGSTYTYSIEYMRVFSPKDETPKEDLVTIEPSYSGGLFAAYSESMPSVDINGLGLTFNREPYYQAFV